MKTGHFPYIYALNLIFYFLIAMLSCGISFRIMELELDKYLKSIFIMMVGGGLTAISYIYATKCYLWSNVRPRPTVRSSPAYEEIEYIQNVLGKRHQKFTMPEDYLTVGIYASTIEDSKPTLNTNRYSYAPIPMEPGDGPISGDTQPSLRFLSEEEVEKLSLRPTAIPPAMDSEPNKESRIGKTPIVRVLAEVDSQIRSRK